MWPESFKLQISQNLLAVQLALYHEACQLLVYTCHHSFSGIPSKPATSVTRMLLTCFSCKRVQLRLLELTVVMLLIYVISGRNIEVSVFLFEVVIDSVGIADLPNRQTGALSKLTYTLRFVRKAQAT